MKITTILEKDGGVYQFTADLTPEQHMFLLEYAVSDLVQKGLLSLPTPTASGEEPAVN